MGTWSKLRLFGALAFGAVGLAIGSVFSGERLVWWPSFAVGGAAAGFLATPWLLRPLERFVRQVNDAPITTITVGVMGLVMGLVVAALLAVPLSYLPGRAGTWTPLAVTLVLASAGLAVVLSRERQVLQLLRLIPGESPVAPQQRNGQVDGKIVLDTSAIIDGRIADISQTGFVRGTLVVPQFVLDELRHIADSSDSQRRTRGRRGLEVLNRLRKEAGVPFQIADEWVDASEVDGKLVKLAQRLHASILTTDFNLNRVAEIQDVRVLNVNELANALRPVLLPGEELHIEVVQEGKEAGQGIGFLDDGTMVVVEGGRRCIGSEVGLVVTRILQTAAGRIIFAHPKSN